MEQTENKRRLSSASEAVKPETVTKRLKSVDELSNRLHNMNSGEDAMLESVSRSTSLDMQSISRATSVESSKSGDIDLDIPSDHNDNEQGKRTAEYRRDSYLPTYSETMEMMSQMADDEMFDESACFRDESEVGDGSRCKLLQRLSRSILSMDEVHFDQVDGPQETDDVVEVDGPQGTDSVCEVLAYMQQVPPETRTLIAQYLSSGNLDHAKLTIINIHNFYHVASLLRLKQLRDHCVKFCSKSNQVDLLMRFEGCKCHVEINMESTSGYQRSHSVISDPGDNDPPQYFIAFSQKITSESNEKCKPKVVVVDMSKRRAVYAREVEKLRNFGESFSCCSFEVKGTPFIAVSGGEGKSSNLVMKYDIILGRWDKCAKLLHGRYNHMMLWAGSNSLFVLGGAETSCIEEYSMKSNKWIERASLVTRVQSCAYQVYKNKIYIFGGKTPAGPVAITQCYDVETHVIERLQDMPCTFEGGSAVVLNDRIYIATYHGHMIKFNPNTGYSSLCTQQPVPRNLFGMFVKSDRIYLVGGVLCNQDESLSSSQVPQYRYNPEKDLWVEKYKLRNSFPVFTSCIINYEKKCCVIPFNETF